MLTACTILAVATILIEPRLLLVHAIPQNEFVNYVGGGYSGNTNVFNPNYVFNSFAYTKDGTCVHVISVAGRGVDDSFQVPCTDVENMITLTTSDMMVVGDPNKFCVVSDSPSTLIVIRDGKCTRRTYTTTNGQTTSTSTPLTDDECKAVFQKITDEQEKNRKYWNEWATNFEDHMNKMFPPGFPFNH
uniref:Uncharacterized protein n=1 Tax=Cuerna arida TaxID=1464854 RepID=A0A1B6F6U4_9HEMI